MQLGGPARPAQSHIWDIFSREGAGKRGEIKPGMETPVREKIITIKKKIRKVCDYLDSLTSLE